MQFKQDFFEQLEGFYSQVYPLPISNPHWLGWSDDAAQLIGLEKPNAELLMQLSANYAAPGASYYAQVYSGHQFGGYTPRLGDGRSIILGEAIGPNGAWDVALKGGGPTPYSRQGDGRAVMRSAVREFLVSEALAALNVPTSRALAVIGSDLPVWRESQETAAITVRLAKSHIRFGHFEYFFHSEQGDAAKLTQLVNFTIQQHFPHLSTDAAGYKQWFYEVVQSTAKMIAHWQSVGFAHGVMNTDNMSILGDTFDFGPFAFLDTFKEGFICNHSDHEGRYAFGQQPGIGLWNLKRLAQTLTPIIESDDLIAALNTYQFELVQQYLLLMRAKLGFSQPNQSPNAINAEEQADLGNKDLQLVGQLTGLLETNQLDYTNSLRRFGQLDPSSAHSSLRDDMVDLAGFDTWYQAYQNRVGEVADVNVWQCERNSANPKYILRNYLAQEAIIAIEENGDNSKLLQLQQLLRRPFDEQPEMEDFAKRPPQWGQGLIMSCSS
ncbi:MULTISPECIES: protein adenylyltransferase SelO [Shewanella]|uniref:protein adenylyltransferase SelO n=1 Tax=Shewanella TaxID=22 RepID=UPI000F4FB523|nr:MULTISPECIES: YdiU family protein [Shewanella]MBB1428221.1 YdiU family protein [Shewanella sp. SG44-2]RPA31940.1 YdiU family protein [Shewanella frigidimarina]|tara:strand:- start:5502 stop:6983 length:1482 start_codon:yes stop_codon:yes gene_type:complete